MIIFLIKRSDIKDLEKTARIYLHSNELKFWKSLPSEKRKNEYLSGRVAVKKLVLNYYKNILATDIETKYTNQRKPYLKIKSINTPLLISISHSDTVAIASGVSYGQVGIDCEKNKVISSRLEDYFISSEEKKLANSFAKDNLSYSMALWTQKESTLKAMGYGLNKPINSVTLLSYRDSKTTLQYKTNKHLQKYYGKIVRYEDHLISSVTTEEKNLDNVSIQEVKV